MAAYFLVEIIEVTDTVKYGEYVAGVRDVVERNGGKYIIRSDRTFLFFGDSCPARVILIEFKDKATLEKCFHCEEYLKIASLREEATRARAFVIEEG
jgi:uncharacterized protein (DUF1330 family)